MKPTGSGGPRKHLIRAGYALALIVGGVQGFVFGTRLGGALMGAIMAINAALFCALMFGAVAGWLSRRQDKAPEMSNLSSRPHGGD